MKKLVLTTLLLLMVVLSACSLVQDYLPGCQGEECEESSQDTNETASYVVIDNPFEFTGNEEDTPDTGVEVIDLNEDTSIDNTSANNEEVDEVTQEDIAVNEEETLAAEDDEEVLASINAIEGDLISLAELVAQDPDGDIIEYSYTEPLSANGDWQTQDGDEGTYLVTVTASDGLLSTSETIKLVVGPSNKGPVIDCPSSLSLEEGTAVELPCTIYDKEGDEVSYTVSGFANELNFETSFDDAGEKEITIVASDGNKETTKTISLTIENTNRAPLVEALGDIDVLEGETVVLDIEAADLDGDDLEITYPLLFDKEGSWETVKGDAGTYELEAIVSDGDSDVVVPINIVVEKLNSAPTLSVDSSIVVDEGDLIKLDILASDVDGDDVSVSITGFMTSDSYQTTFEDAGEYEVVVSATDGKKTVEKTISITVNDVNRPPVFILNV